MKKIILLALILLAVTSHNVRADEKTRIELPGNAVIITDKEAERRNRIYYNDESLAYRALVAPYARPSERVIPNTTSWSHIETACGGVKRTSQMQRCIGDAIKDQKKLQRRYND